MAARFSSTVVALFLLLGSTLTAWGQEGELLIDLEDYVVGWHTVRPDDTLEDVTAQYLGSDKLWKENWKLNPHIEDPHRIWPGQRIMVILDVAEAVPTARLQQLAGRVESRPTPVPWHEAKKDDLLLERDGIQTHEKASTELEFQDGTKVVLTENSLVFVRKAGIELTGVDEKSVEIVEGQADIEANLSSSSSAEVEIIVGGAITTAKLNNEGSSRTRARLADDGGGQVMVYEGLGSVASAGTTVELTPGTGTTVSLDSVPTEPEELLQAPTTREPASGSRLEFSTPHFSWTPVDEAASYTVEICHDPRCGELVDLVLGLDEAGWQPGSLPMGEFYWRVTAVSGTGLDGFPSKPASLAILSALPDTTPPEVSVAATGAAIRVGNTLIFDPNLEIAVEATDSESGMARWVATLDGQEVDEERWKGPWEEGEYSVTAIAYDKAGNPRESKAYEFVVDTEPPTIAWKALGGSGQGRTPIPSKMRDQWMADGHEWLEWSVDGEVWLPMVWGSEASEVRAYLESREMRRRFDPEAPVTIRGSEPQLLLRAPAGNPFAAGAGGALDQGQVLRVYAHDTWSGCRELKFEIDTSGAAPALVIRAEDVLGHVTTLQIPLRGDLG